MSDVLEAVRVNDDGLYSVTVIVIVLDIFAPLVAYTAYVPGVVDENSDEYHELLM
jgi:hypothetical protein